MAEIRQVFCLFFNKIEKVKEKMANNYKMIADMGYYKTYHILTEPIHFTSFVCIAPI